jgi:hypothetical protein
VQQHGAIAFVAVRSCPVTSARIITAPRLCRAEDHGQLVPPRAWLDTMRLDRQACGRRCSHPVLAASPADAERGATIKGGERVPRNWLLGRDVVDDSTFRPPKLLTLYASNLEQAPRYFEIYRYHDSHVRQLLRHFGVSEVTATRSQIDAEEIGNGRYRGDRLWELPTPRARIYKSSGYVFRIDGVGALSPTVYSTKKARATVKRGIHFGTEVVLPVVSADGSFERIIEFEVQWAVDPDMEVSVLTGSELADHAMDLLRDVREDDPENLPDIEVQAPQFVKQLAALYSPPAYWTLTPPPAMHGDENEKTAVEVDMVATSTGSGYFAFRLHDLESSENDEISPIFEIEVAETAEGFAISVVTDFDGLELPLREIA